MTDNHTFFRGKRRRGVCFIETRRRRDGWRASTLLSSHEDFAQSFPRFRDVLLNHLSRFYSFYCSPIYVSLSCSTIVDNDDVLVFLSILFSKWIFSFFITDPAFSFLFLLKIVLLSVSHKKKIPRVFCMISRRLLFLC